jgi:antitoxin Phd
MAINSVNLISIAEADRDFSQLKFSRVARLVDKSGTVIILKNNIPRYVVLDFAQFGSDETASPDEALSVARRILEKHLPAFQELAQ